MFDSITGVGRRLINLDISNKCTLLCPKCRRQNVGKSDESGDLSIEGFKVIAEHFKEILFCGQISDPIFNPHFIEFLKISQQPKYFVKHITIATAASHKPQRWYEEAFNARPHKKDQCSTIWRFGMDGTPEDSPKYRINQDGKYLWKIMKLAVKKGVHVQWQCIVFNYNEDYVDDLKYIAREEGMEFLKIYSSRWDKTDDPYKPSAANHIPSLRWKY
jgi:MoaA/NifB/PqqE/SkfB family radical SAM enzyme